MIVCLCANVSQKEIRRLVREGAHHVKDIRKASGAGANCCACIKQIKAIIEEEKALAKHHSYDMPHQFKVLKLTE